MRIVVLSSGGIDSTIMIKLLLKRGHRLFPLFVDYGQLAADLEWKACQKMCKHLDLKPKRMDVHGFGSLIPSGLTRPNMDIEKEAFVPTRNLLLLTLGAAYGYAKSAHVVAIGLIANPIFPDQTEEFISESEKTISQALGTDISILCPLISLNKMDTLQLARKHGLQLEQTYSCHSGTTQPCGRCISCKEKIEAEKGLANYSS
ncbi:MAG: 7-cyano-7-deazaguanine synthase [Candidatus Hodarchaeota archaeon]